MSKYVNNPTETKKLISQFSSLTTATEIQNFIETNFPDWLVGSTESYCPDYPHLQHNWGIICQLNKVEPQKIVVVDHIDFGQTDSLLNTICETMTKRGYVVRRKKEFTGCEVCGKAIPVIDVWCLLKEKGLSVPKVWSPSCSGCLKKSLNK